MNWLDSPIINAFRFTATVAFLLFIVSSALVHHGGGTFDNTKTIELKGRLTVLARHGKDGADAQLHRQDPVYFKGQYTGSDVIQVADLPYKPDACKEQAFIDYSKAAQNQK